MNDLKNKLQNIINMLEDLSEQMSEGLVGDEPSVKLDEIIDYIELVKKGIYDNETIELANGVKVFIKIPYQYAKCKACKKEIIWGQTLTGKFIPVFYDLEKKLWLTHFTDCPKANNFRKSKPYL